MSIQITIRNVPREVRNELAARAARAGKSMQEFLRGELERIASRPSLADWLDKVRREKELTGRNIGSGVILAVRDADRK